MGKAKQHIAAGLVAHVRAGRGEPHKITLKQFNPRPFQVGDFCILWYIRRICFLCLIMVTKLILLFLALQQKCKHL